MLIPKKLAYVYCWVFSKANCIDEAEFLPHLIRIPWQTFTGQFDLMAALVPDRICFEMNMSSMESGFAD